MTELVHTKNTCTANDLCLGGVTGLFCGNCGAGLQSVIDAPNKDEEGGE